MIGFMCDKIFTLHLKTSNLAKVHLKEEEKANFILFFSCFQVAEINVFSDFEQFLKFAITQKKRDYFFLHLCLEGVLLAH